MVDKYDYIVNPKTKRKVKVKSKLGKSLIESYKKELIGGADCQISDYLVGEEKRKKELDLKKYIADQQRYFNSLSILANKRNIERLLLISEVEHLFNGLREEIEEEIREFEEALGDCDRKTGKLGLDIKTGKFGLDTILNKIIAIKFNQKASFLLAKNKFLKKVQKFLQNKEASVRDRLPEYLVSSGLVSDKANPLSGPTQAVINRNNLKIQELRTKKDNLLMKSKKECVDNQFKIYYFSLEEKGNLLKFLWKFYKEINTDIDRQLKNDQIKINEELCKPITKIYRMPIDTTEDIRKKYRYAGEMDGALSSNKDGSLDYRTYSANETINRLKKAAIDPERINDLDYFENIKLLIAKDFFGDEFRPFESEECAKKCSCLIDGKSESSCFGKVWSNETKSNITKDKIRLQTSKLYKEDIETLMEKLNN